MVETVIILPFVMAVIVLLIYLGWNFRRQAQVTNMDRYAVWQRVTPGASGPNAQHVPAEMRNPRMNNAFYGLTGDQARQLDELRDNPGYTPRSHETLRDRQADETYSYFNEFLERNPRAIEQRFTAKHDQINTALERMGMSNTTRDPKGHSRLNGDWRYVNGIRYNGGLSKWVPANGRVSPGSAMREVFFAEMDDGLEVYDSRGNKLANAIRNFYLSYPGYRGPDISRDRRNRNPGDPFAPGGAF